MYSQSQDQSYRPRVEDEFIELLHSKCSKWTRTVACQNECGEACSCQRKIVHVEAIEKWWSEQVTESPGQTRGHLFLDEMPSDSHRKFPPTYQNIFTGENCCVRVLSLLLQRGRGSLIDLFHEGAMHDKYLIRGANDQVLRDSLRGRNNQENVDTIVQDFHRDKWAYCPMELAQGMAFNAQGTKVIPPFCHKIRLSDKGGTASIYWVAVQKDLISDSRLADTLSDSLYHDEDYGQCYQMILKSYFGNKRSVFDLERQAFVGLESKEGVPILRYLGSYIHDYGEGRDRGATYNILLEYGDNDLYQAWADETNVPPVRAQEILRTWDSLFEIAKAIRHVHDLEIPRGGGSKPRKFHGWHADIKPDNILSIRGRLKLSDFGFSSFAPVIEGHARSKPTEIITGFTDTYGAPEVFRMQGADGTLSGVTQSIDIWSFGCVLSVAATWIVLGFQGIRQYEQLRQLATSNCQGKETYDRFHDGTKALREIRKWHNYLRGHLRPSDTTTEQVLTLIENKLLNEEPSERPDSKTLCLELQTIHDRAQDGIQRLQQHSKETDAAVLMALSKIEEIAHNQRVPEAKTDPEHLLQPTMPTGASQVNPRQRVSMQRYKDRTIHSKRTTEAKTNPEHLLQPMMPTGASQVNPPKWASMQRHRNRLIHSKPLGQTPYRQEILKQELGQSTFGLPDNGEHTNHDGHNGDFTLSPKHSTSVQVFQIPSPPPMPRYPQSRKTDQTEHSIQSHAVENEVGGQSATPKTPTPQQRHVKSEDDSQNVWMAFSDRYGVPDPRKLEHNMDSTLEVTSEGLMPASRPFVFKPFLPQITTEHMPLSPPYTPGTKNLSHSMLPEQSSLKYQAQREDEVQGSSPGLTSPSSKDSIYAGKQVYNAENMQVHPPDIHDRLEQVPDIQSPDMSHESQNVERTLPPSVLDLPYSICKKRKKLDQEKPGMKGKLKSMVGKEDRTMDPSLKDISSDRRELVFIVDNGWTMFEHWPILIFVVETLAMNAAGIDKSGIDLRFTVEGNRHNANKIVGGTGRRRLVRKLTDAWPEGRRQDNVTTNMVTVFQKVYEEWEVNERPATTLYVFTNGKWAKDYPTALGERVLKFAEQDLNGTGKRHFSIQLIRFGDDETDKKQLQWLDDRLCSSLNLRDIIDHCSWRASVDKIFKGSMDGFHDQEDDEELPVLYNYKELVKKFNKFNKGQEIQDNGGHDARHLSPPTSSQLQRSLSQHSGRSFTSAPRKRDSAPPETPKRQSGLFSRSSFSP